MLITEYYPQFFTATILEWKHLLIEDKYKDIIIESLRFLVKEKRVVVYSFVLMPNHIHIIFTPLLVFSAASPTTRNKSNFIHDNIAPVPLISLQKPRLT